MLKRHLKLQREAAGDLIGMAHYSWDPQTNELKWDVRIKAWWGLPPDIEPDYVIWLNGIHPDDVDRVLAAVARCKDPRGDGVYDIKYRVIGLDGVERLVLTRGRTFFKNGQSTHFAGVMLNITAGHGLPEKIKMGYLESAFQTCYQQLIERIERKISKGTRATSKPSWAEPAPPRDFCCDCSAIPIHPKRSTALTTWSPNCASFMKAAGLPPPGIPVGGNREQHRKVNQ
jgi:hypothetical protein